MTPIALNWGDMDMNGVPGLRRLLEALQVAVNKVESQQSIGLHRSENRLAALECALTGLAEVTERLAKLEAQIDELSRSAASTTERPTGCASRPASSPDGMDIAGAGMGGNEMVLGPVVRWDGPFGLIDGEVPKEWRHGNHGSNGACAEADQPGDRVRD